MEILVTWKISINKKMETRSIRLTESQLHDIIKESVVKVLTEMDWKTYNNAAIKLRQQGWDDRADNLSMHALSAYDRKYAPTKDDYRKFIPPYDNSLTNGENGQYYKAENDKALRDYNNDRTDYMADIDADDAYRKSNFMGRSSDAPNNEWTVNQYNKHRSDADEKVKMSDRLSVGARKRMLRGMDDYGKYINGKSEYIPGKGWN